MLPQIVLREKPCQGPKLNGAWSPRVRMLHARRMSRLALLLCLLLAACTVHDPLTYAPPPTQTVVPHHPTIGDIIVADERGLPMQDYGAVMGPDGRPLKRVASPTSVADDVARAFRTALAARGELAAPGRGRFELHVAIVELGAEQYAERQGAVDLIIRLINRGNGREVYSTRVYAESRGHNFLAEDNQLLGSPSALSRVASSVLDQAVNQVLDRPGFARKLS
jgi:hypothetical protein